MWHLLSSPSAYVVAKQPHKLFHDKRMINHGTYEKWQVTPRLTLSLYNTSGRDELWSAFGVTFCSSWWFCHMFLLLSLPASHTNGHLKIKPLKLPVYANTWLSTKLFSLWASCLGLFSLLTTFKSQSNETNNFCVWVFSCHG